MDEKVSRRLKRADELENIIADFRMGNDPADVRVIRQNKVEKLNDEIHTLSNAYKEAIGIYCTSLKKTSDEDTKQAILNRLQKLLENLFDQASTGYWHSSLLSLQILLCISNFLTQIEELIPGISQRLYGALQRSIHHKLMQSSWSDLPLAFEGLKLMRRISEGNEAELDVDGLRLCHLIELIATTCVTDVAVLEHPTDRQGQLAHAIQVYEEGVQFARTVDVGYADRFASKASDLRRIHNRMPPEPLFAEPLGRAVAEATKRQHQESFLPSIQELIQEYESKSNSLEELLSDVRFELSSERVQKWAEKYPNSPLKDLFGMRESRTSDKEGARIIDSNENPLGVMSVDREFILQYVNEIQISITAIFNAWRQNGNLTKEQVSSKLNQSYSDFDWRIVHMGLLHYFETSDFISASHLLIPQLEGLLVSWAAKNGIKKKVRRDQVGELYLSDLVRRKDFQNLLGPELSNLISWCLVNRNATRYNYRNNISHGFVNFDTYNWEVVASVAIWLHLKTVNAIKKAT